MKIIKLDVSSIDELLQIYNEQFKNESWSKTQILDSFNNKAVSFYGIYEKNELVCFSCVLNTLDDINLLDIATREKYKCKGYATKMLEFLLLLKSDEQTFSLEVKSKNLKAIKLYEKFNFKTLIIRRKYYKDGDDALCMFLQ